MNPVKLRRIAPPLPRSQPPQSRGQDEVLFNRRVRFSVIIMASQLLLLAMAIGWLVHMSLIAANGAVYFVEENPLILWAEIIMVSCVTLFASIVFILQYKRLRERRQGERRQGERRQ